MPDRGSENAGNDRAVLAAGIEFLRTRDSVPLITGLPDTDVTAEARKLGAIDVFMKPIDWEKLLKLVAYTVQ